MKEYIEREAAFFALAHNFYSDEMTLKGYDRILAALANLPAADVRPVVRGEWLRTDAYPHHLYCSVCYTTYLPTDELLEMYRIPMNYCPNCGADMRGENNDN